MVITLIFPDDELPRGAMGNANALSSVIDDLRSCPKKRRPVETTTRTVGSRIILAAQLGTKQKIQVYLLKFITC